MKNTFTEETDIVMKNWNIWVLGQFFIFIHLRVLQILRRKITPDFPS